MSKHGVISRLHEGIACITLIGRNIEKKTNIFICRSKPALIGYFRLSTIMLGVSWLLEPFNNRQRCVMLFFVSMQHQCPSSSRWHKQNLPAGNKLPFLFRFHCRESIVSIHLWNKPVTIPHFFLKSNPGILVFSRSYRLFAFTIVLILAWADCPQRNKQSSQKYFQIPKKKIYKLLRCNENEPKREENRILYWNKVTNGLRGLEFFFNIPFYLDWSQNPIDITGPDGS